MAALSDKAFYCMLHLMQAEKLHENGKKLKNAGGVANPKELIEMEDQEALDEVEKEKEKEEKKKAAAENKEEKERKARAQADFVKAKLVAITAAMALPCVAMAWDEEMAAKHGTLEEALHGADVRMHEDVKVARAELARLEKLRREAKGTAMAAANKHAAAVDKHVSAMQELLQRVANARAYDPSDYVDDVRALVEAMGPKF